MRCGRVEERDWGEAVGGGEILRSGYEIVRRCRDTHGEFLGRRITACRVRQIRGDAADREHDGFHLVENGGRCAGARNVEELIDGDLELCDMNVFDKTGRAHKWDRAASRVGSPHSEIICGDRRGGILDFRPHVAVFPRLDLILEVGHPQRKPFFALCRFMRLIGKGSHLLKEIGRLPLDLVRH